MTMTSKRILNQIAHKISTKMGFFRDRRRARAEAAREQQQRMEAESSAHGQDAMMSEEAALAAEARRMMLGDGAENDLPDSSTSGDPTTTTTALSADQEQKVLALHYHFDADRDGFLSYPELQSLQQTTSGAAMSVQEYTMICHALQCDPRKGISLDALRVTYASVQAEDGEANLDLDYDTIFGRGGAGDDDANASSSSSAGEACARSNSYDHQLSSVTEESDIMEDAADDDEQAEIPVEVDAPRLEMGDHVFRRRAAGLAQVHAIVVSMAPGDDGPLLLADFTGQNVVGEDDDDDGEDDGNDDDNVEEEEGDGETPETQNGVTQNNDNDGQNEPNKKAATAEEEPPDPTVERVRIICIEGKKNIRKWKKVRYGGSRFGSWFKRKSKENAKDSGKAPGTPKRSKSAVEEASDVTLDESSSEYSPSKLTNQTAEDDEDALPPQQQTPKAKEAKNKKRDDDLPETDPGTLVVQRVNFLLENQNLIPPWHALKSNSECLAVWCKTGRWSTYQVSGYLNTIFMGQAKTAATVAAAASSATVTVPAAGYMGWLGFTTQVSLLALHPWLIPAIAGYGIASIGVPMYILKRCGKQWAKTTIDLNDEFWSRAPPEVYVDCIRKWAGLEDEEDD